MRIVLATLLILMTASVAMADKDLYRHCEPCVGVQGTLFPTASWQVQSGFYAGDDNMAFYFCAMGGETYTFTFCQGGGSADYDTALSIQGPDGCGSYLACNDDFCGLQSEISWVAPADGTYIVAVDGYGTATGNFNLAYMGTPCTTPTKEESWSVIKSAY
jgi:hypothetical protein